MVCTKNQCVSWYRKTTPGGSCGRLQGPLALSFWKGQKVPAGSALRKLSIFAQGSPMLLKLSIFAQGSHVLLKLSIFAQGSHVLLKLSIFTQGSQVLLKRSIFAQGSPTLLKLSIFAQGSHMLLNSLSSLVSGLSSCSFCPTIGSGWGWVVRTPRQKDHAGIKCALCVNDKAFILSLVFVSVCRSS